MGHLIGRDLLEVGVERCVESNGGKVGLSIVGKTLTVEGVLEMLQGQGIVELKRILDLSQLAMKLPELKGNVRW